MLKLYDNRLSGNGYKTRLLMHQLGMPFEVEWVDILKGETRTPEFLAINPNGRIPTLVDSDYILPESNAILCYLADGTPFLPDNRQVKGRILQWLFFEQYSHEPNIATVRHWLAHLGYDADDPQVLERQTKGEMVLERAPERPALLRWRRLYHRGYRALRLYPSRMNRPFESTR